MKAQDLRIGNWVEYDDWHPDYEVKGIEYEPYDDIVHEITSEFTVSGEEYYFILLNGGGGAAVDKIKPIPLTEGWLLRSEFNFKELGFPDLSISYGQESGEIHFVAGNYHHKLNHVHEMQNMYRDFVRKELEIKSKGLAGKSKPLT